MKRKPIEFQNHPISFPNPHIVRGVVRHVVDGDTFDVLIDMGFNQYTYATVRVLGVDTPELIGTDRVAGLAAKHYAETLLLNRPVKLTVYPDRLTFGRYVASVEVLTPIGWVDLAADIRAAGHHKPLPNAP